MPRKPTGDEIRRVQEALLDAFDSAGLEQFVRVRLDTDLELIAPRNANLNQAAYHVVRHCAAQPNGFVQLLRTAAQDRPEHQALQDLLHELGGLDFDALPAAKPAGPLLFVVLIAGVGIVLALVLYLVVAPLLPRKMPDGTFNIAVAEISAVDTDDRPVTFDGARELSEQIAGFIDTQKETLGNIIGSRVVVWGPAQRVGAVTPDQEERQAAALNADVLIHGVLRQRRADGWQLEPHFYLAPASEDDAGRSEVRRNEEVFGDHVLGSAIPYRETDAGRRSVTQALQVRLVALTQIVVGLQYLLHGDAQGYADAVEVFRTAAEESAWAKTDDDTGQEVLYLFLGNAYLSRAFVTEEDVKRTEMLMHARDAFSNAVAMNDTYARSYTGLASSLYQLARPRADDDPCAFEWDLLAAAGSTYETALGLPLKAKPDSGQVDFRASFGLARVRFAQGLCADEFDQARAFWQQAQDLYETAIREFEAMGKPIPHALDVAAYAHTDLASMSVLQAEYWSAQSGEDRTELVSSLLSSAISHYESSIQLAQRSGTDEGATHARDTMPWLLTALCIADPGDGDRAIDALDQFVSSVDDPATARAYIVDKIEPELWKECTHE